MGPEDEFIEQLADRQSRSWARPIAWGVAIALGLGWIALIGWIVARMMFG